VRRVAFVVATLLFFSAFGVASLVSRLSGGAPGATSPFAVAAVSGVVIFALLYTVVRRVGMPLGGIVEAANRLAEGDFSTRVAEYGPESLRTVAKAFNTMATRLESHDQQRRHLMADIAHELRTPLSVIQGRLEGFLDGVYPRDDERMEALLEETRLLARLVEDLRTLANAESGALTLHKEPTDLAVLVQEVVEAFSADAARVGASLRCDLPRDVPFVTVDPIRIREVLSNIVSNAIRHTPAGGAVSVAVASAKTRVLLSVTDTGSGIAPEDLPRIFDRFYKGEGSRGSGLGLTIARSLVAAHGGDISAESAVGRGTTITVMLPMLGA
jgi:two-component system OmpR family sensor kinase/two-component system sensor histidine kinase BaeS